MTSSTENATVDARIYRLLARLWIAEVDETLLQTLSEEPTRDLWESLGGFVPTGDLHELVDQLGCEYCACFIGPKGHLPPHQSVVEQSHFQGDCLSSMNQFVEIIGAPEHPLFQPRQSMPDHIGMQLALVAEICDAQAAVPNADENSNQQTELAELKAAFFQHHLAWIDRYCVVAKERSSSDFYGGLFAVTQAFLAFANKDQPDSATDSMG